MAKKKQTRVAANRKEFPWGIKVISVLYYVISILAIIIGIVFIAGAGFIVRQLTEQIPGLTAGATSSLFIGLGIVAIVLAIVGFFVARGLWAGKNWARIVAIVVAILGLIGALWSLPTGNAIISDIVKIVIHAVIGGYLLFNKKVRETFK